MTIPSPANPTVRPPSVLVSGTGRGFWPTVRSGSVQSHALFAPFFPIFVGFRCLPHRNLFPENAMTCENASKTTWRWGESNPLRSRFGEFHSGCSEHIWAAQSMFLALPLATLRCPSEPSNRVKSASPRHFRVT